MELGSALERTALELMFIGQNILNIINKLPARYASTWAWFTNMLLWTKWCLLSSRYCPNVQRWMSSFGIQKHTRGQPVGRQFPQMLLFVPGGSTCSIPITEERIKDGEWG